MSKGIALWGMTRAAAVAVVIAGLLGGVTSAALAQDDAKRLDIEVVCNDDGLVELQATLTMYAIIGTDLRVRFNVPPFGTFEGFIPQGGLVTSITIPTGQTSIAGGTATAQVSRLLRSGWEPWSQPAWSDTWTAVACPPPTTTTTTTEPPVTTTTTIPPTTTTTTTTEPPVTTTTIPVTTTTTIVGPTTTTIPVEETTTTTTVDDTTTTTEAGATTTTSVVVTTTTPPPSGEELPRTGSSLAYLAFVGSMLALSGGAAIAVGAPARRRD